MVVVIKTLMKLLTYFKTSVGQRFRVTVLFLMVTAWCHDKLRCLPYCDVITKCLLGTNHNLGLKLLGLRGHYMRPYFNCPNEPESHYAAVLNIFMYIYASYAVSAFCVLLNNFFLQV